MIRGSKAKDRGRSDAPLGDRGRGGLMEGEVGSRSVLESWFETTDRIRRDNCC